LRALADAIRLVLPLLLPAWLSRAQIVTTDDYFRDKARKSGAGGGDGSDDDDDATPVNADATPALNGATAQGPGAHSQAMGMQQQHAQGAVEAVGQASYMGMACMPAMVQGGMLMQAQPQAVQQAVQQAMPQQAPHAQVIQAQAQPMPTVGQPDVGAGAAGAFQQPHAQHVPHMAHQGQQQYMAQPHANQYGASPVNQYPAAHAQFVNQDAGSRAAALRYGAQQEAAVMYAAHPVMQQGPFAYASAPPGQAQAAGQQLSDGPYAAQHASMGYQRSPGGGSGVPGGGLGGASMGCQRPPAVANNFMPTSHYAMAAPGQPPPTSAASAGGAGGQPPSCACCGTGAVLSMPPQSFAGSQPHVSQPPAELPTSMPLAMSGVLPGGGGVPSQFGSSMAPSTSAPPPAARPQLSIFAPERAPVIAADGSMQSTQMFDQTPAGGQPMSHQMSMSISSAGAAGHVMMNGASPVGTPVNGMGCCAAGMGPPTVLMQQGAHQQKAAACGYPHQQQQQMGYHVAVSPVVSPLDPNAMFAAATGTLPAAPPSY
jgi:hypothetical protein